MNELEQYISQRRDAGVPTEEIKRELLTAGWPEEAIGQYLNFSNQAQSTSLLSASSLLKQSLSFYGRHFIQILLIVLPLVILKIFNLIFIQSISTNPIYQLIYIILAFTIDICVSPIFFSFVTNSDSGISRAYRDGLSKIFPYFWIGILALLVFFGGFILLIIPGIILGLLVSQSVYVLYVENIKGIDALVQSWQYTAGRLWSIFWRNTFFILLEGLIYLIFVLIALFSAIHNFSNLGIPGTTLYQLSLYLLLIPLGIIYNYFLFKSLKETSSPLSNEHERKIRRKLKMFMIVGPTTALLGFLWFFYRLLYP